MTFLKDRRDLRSFGRFWPIWPIWPILPAPNEKPRAASLTGVDGGLKAHAVGGLQRRDESSHGALEASDCFQFYQGWLPGGCLNESGNCRLTRSRAAGKRNFSISVSTAIAELFDTTRKETNTKQASPKRRRQPPRQAPSEPQIDRRPQTSGNPRILGGFGLSNALSNDLTI